MSPIERAPTWKRFTAATFDFLMLFVGGGFLVGWLTGGLTTFGFSLTGMPALLLFAIMIGYFFIGRHFAGGTLWDRAFGVHRPQPD